MKKENFDDFYRYIKNIHFTHITQRREGSNSELLYTDSLIEMMYDFNDHYIQIKDKLIDLKAIVDTKEIYNAKLESFVH